MSTQKTINLILLFFGLLVYSSAKAQWQQPCFEPNRVNEFFQCFEPRYSPVCGCDEKTYRNQCVSYNVSGINWLLSDGVCKNDVFGFDFYPNPSTEIINFSLQFFDRGNMTVQIFDTYGKLMYFKNMAQVTRYDDVIYVGNFRPGLYVITVISGSIYRAKKLIVR
jgi:hypothetical protein